MTSSVRIANLAQIDQVGDPMVEVLSIQKLLDGTIEEVSFWIANLLQISRPKK